MRGSEATARRRTRRGTLDVLAKSTSSGLAHLSYKHVHTGTRSYDCPTLPGLTRFLKNTKAIKVLVIQNLG